MGYNLNDMIRKVYAVECDWCGEPQNFGTIDDVSKYYWLYRLKKINPLADELYLKNKPNNVAFKYLTFCSETCKDKYFEEWPEDIPHYKKVGKYDQKEVFNKIMTYEPE